MSKNLYIMRGVPGSGKSYEAKQLVGDEGMIFSTDDQWGTDLREYKENWAKAQKEGNVGAMLGRYHRRNLELATEAMEAGIETVVIDNTNVDRRSMLPYVQAGLKNGYEVHFKEPSSSWWAEVKPYLVDKKDDRALDRAATRLEYRNDHGVPAAAIKKMLLKWWNKDDLCVEDFKS